MGYAQCNVDFPNADVSPYLALENVDPEWLKAVGYEGPSLAGKGEGKEEEGREAKEAGVGGNALVE